MALPYFIHSFGFEGPLKRFVMIGFIEFGASGVPHYLHKRTSGKIYSHMGFRDPVLRRTSHCQECTEKEAWPGTSPSFRAFGLTETGEVVDFRISSIWVLQACYTI
jgi:hypothetical protein